MGDNPPPGYCTHPRLQPTEWDQPKPKPWKITSHCPCGTCYTCPVCGHGRGQWPCEREEQADE